MSTEEITININSGSNYSIESNGVQVVSGSNAGIHIILFNAASGQPMRTKQD